MTYSVLGFDAEGSQVQVSQSSRREGMYLIGATGTGKSTLIENLAIDDVKNGLGVCVIDPHGDLTNAIISRLAYLSEHDPKERMRELFTQRLEEDVILIDLASREYVAPFNLFHCEDPNDVFEVENVVSAFMHILESVYQISPLTPQMSQYFTAIAHTLIYNSNYTLLDIDRLLTDKTFRAKLVANIPDPHVKWFWNVFFEEYRRGIERGRDISAVVNKLDEFIKPVMKHWFGTIQKTLNFRELMDEKKLVFIKLNSQWGNLTKLIGNIVIAQLLDAAYSRNNIPVKKRRQMNIYVDEFQKFASEDFATLFTEARKFGLGLTISHQVISQVPEKIKETCEQSANIVVFKVSANNAEELASVFDATPPMGEPTYERLMKEVINHVDETYWEPPEAEEQLQRVERKLAQAYTNESFLRVLFLQNNVFVDEVEDKFAYRYKDGHHVDATFNPDYLRWFYPSAADPHVQTALKSCYAPEKSNRKQEAQVLPAIKPNIGYKFPSTLISIIEYVIANNTLTHYIYRYTLESSVPELSAKYSNRDEVSIAPLNREGKGIKKHGYGSAYNKPPPMVTISLKKETFNAEKAAFLNELATVLRPIKEQARFYFDFDKFTQYIRTPHYVYLIRSIDTIPFDVMLDFWRMDVPEKTFQPFLEWASRKMKIVKEEMYMLFDEWVRLRSCFKTRSVPVYTGEYIAEKITFYEYSSMSNYVDKDENVLYKKIDGKPLYGSDEVVRRTANQIKQFPKYTAKVRLETGEHTITTLEPKGYVKDSDLKEWIAEIQKRNVEQGYLRLRSDVEEEIRKRNQPPDDDPDDDGGSPPSGSSGGKPKEPPKKPDSGSASSPNRRSPTPPPTPRKRKIGS